MPELEHSDCLLVPRTKAAASASHLTLLFNPRIYLPLSDSLGLTVCSCFDLCYACLTHFSFSVTS